MLAYDPSTNPLNNNEWSYPLAECIHIASMALSIGCIVLVDLRLLGLGIKSTSAKQLVRDTDLWVVIGLFLAIATGLLIFSTDPVHFMENGPFQFKMAILLAGILYNYTLHRSVAFSPSGLAPVVALVSILIWISPIAAGIFSAFV